MQPWLPKSADKTDKNKLLSRQSTTISIDDEQCSPASIGVPQQRGRSGDRAGSAAATQKPTLLRSKSFDRGLNTPDSAVASVIHIFSVLISEYQILNYISLSSCYAIQIRHQMHRKRPPRVCYGPTEKRFSCRAAAVFRTVLVRSATTIKHRTHTRNCARCRCPATHLWSKS